MMEVGGHTPTGSPTTTPPPMCLDQDNARPRLFNPVYPGSNHSYSHPRPRPLEATQVQSATTPKMRLKCRSATPPTIVIPSAQNRDYLNVRYL